MIQFLWAQNGKKECYVAFGNGAAVKNRTEIRKGEDSILSVSNSASASKVLSMQSLTNKPMIQQYSSARN